ncbi:hypothetical protein Tco_0000060 [Tanacetum coccineum]
MERCYNGQLDRNSDAHLYRTPQVDAPPVNDDNANANEDNADFINNEDDVLHNSLDDDDLDMKAMQDKIKAGLIPFKTDQEILDEIRSSDTARIVGHAGSYRVVAHFSQSPNRAFWRCYDSGSDHADVQATRARERVAEEAR